MVTSLRWMNWWEGEGGHVQCMGEKENAYIILVRKPKEVRPLWTTRHQWEDNIKTYLQEVEWKVMDWINLTQNKDKWRIYVNNEI